MLALIAPASALAKDVPVTNVAQLGAAISAAQPNDVILLDDGVYESTGFSCTVSGTSSTPIVVRSKNPGGATVRFNALEGFKVSGDHWRFENLVVQGVCPQDDDCEHAFHVIGASGFVLRGSKVSDFNAQLKVNARNDAGAWKLPHAGLIEGNEIFDTRARNTSNPTTKLNIDSGDDWIVRANVIHDFQKNGGDDTSYATFLKCGGQRGIVERNLVMCARDFAGGTRLGLSFGGGGCAPQFCQPSFDASVPCIEHTDGILRNNVVANCTDVGVYVNKSPNSRILYNTLIGTAGIDFRFAESTGEARGNVLEGIVRNREGSTAVFANNLASVTPATFAGWYVDPLKGNLTKKGDLSPLVGQGTAVALVTDDFCGRARVAPFDLGALQHSLGDCASTPPVFDGGTSPDGSTLPPAGDGGLEGGANGADGGSGGVDGGTANGAVPGAADDDGCSCRTAPATGPLLPSLAALAFLVWRRRRA